MHKTMVSIIMPAYNSSKYIAQSIESVLEQTYWNWELLIVDDCSVDNTCDIAEYYVSKDSRIKLLRLKKNKGPAVARNIATKLANGRFVAFIDSDDMWLKNKLEVQIHFMLSSNIGLSYSSYQVIDEFGDYKTCFCIPRQQVSYKSLLKSCIIGNLTAMYDIEIVGKCYMLNVGHEDYTLWLNILKKTEYAFGISSSLACYRISDGSISKNKMKAAAWQWNIYRNVEKLSFVASIYYFLNYAFNGILKYQTKIKILK